jgi:hypothetical protein
VVYQPLIQVVAAVIVAPALWWLYTTFQRDRTSEIENSVWGVQSAGLSNQLAGNRVNVSSAAPCESSRRGAPHIWRQKLKINAFELCTNDDSANCQRYGLASLVAAAGLG